MRKDILIYFLGKLVPALVNLFLIILVVRFLGKDEYGKYSLISYFALLIVQLCFTWIQQGMIRFLTLYRENPSEILSGFFLLTLASMLAGVMIVLVAGWLYFRLALPELVTVSVYTSLFILFSFRLTLYQAFMKPLKYALYEGTYNVTLLLFLLGFIYIVVYRSFLMVFVSMGTGFLLTEIMHYLLMKEPAYRIHPGNLRWDRAFTKRMADYGFPLTIWIFISTFSLMADRYIIKEFDGYGAAGTYAAIKDLATKISTFLLLPVLIAYLARINDAWNSRDYSRARSLIRQALWIELAIGAVATAAFLGMSNFLYSRILHLAGERLFITSLFLILSAFLWQAALLFHKPLELLFRQRTMLVLITIALAVNLTLNLILVPAYGFPAAAAASLASVSVYSILNILYSKKLLRRHEHDNQKDPSGGRKEDIPESC